MRVGLLALWLVGCGAAEKGDGVDGDGPDTDRADTDAIDSDDVDTDPAPDADADGVPDAEDCAPDDPTRAPGLAERCDAADVDEDCDGLADDADDDVVGQVDWFVDGDGDGYGDAVGRSCDAPSASVGVGGDCEDGDARVNPGAEERCGGGDEDCDSLFDDADPDVVGQTAWFEDLDGDGVGDREARACVAPPRHVGVGGDCDDGDPAVSPLAAEVCDAANVDEDCDGLADDRDASVDPALKRAWYVDLDDDGFGSGPATARCDAASGEVATAGDCDDSRADVLPGGREVCGGVDEDCDGLTDDADGSVDPATRSVWYPDGDGDGFGGAAAVARCAPPPGYLAAGGDCDDASASVSPIAAERCDEDDVDEDCDGRADDADDGAAGQRTWYADLDGDGAAGASSRQACDPAPGERSVSADCDDADAAVSPTAAERCNEVDDDCDGRVDDADVGVVGQVAWFADGDGDGVGAGEAVVRCALAGGVRVDGDCDDGDAAVRPGADEVCDGGDEDCDGLVDDADPSRVTTRRWYADGDGDGWGAGAPVVACVADERVDRVGDCDDAEATVSPGADERCDPADADEDCDGLVDDADPGAVGAVGWYADSDGDGYGDFGRVVFACDLGPGRSADPLDCDDGAAAVSPGATEVCDPFDVDEDCDGAADDAGGALIGRSGFWRDADGDGWGAGAQRLACDAASGEVGVAGDCDDAEPSVSPAAPEVCDPADVDEDCDGAADDADASATGLLGWYVDADGDGFGDLLRATQACDLGPGRSANPLDCDDGAAGVSPDAAEVCDLLDVDEDCDGLADDADVAAGRFVWRVDGDGDGFGGPATTLACDVAPGRTADTSDCDDGRADVSPVGVEVCDDVDQDCDGAADDGLARYFADADGDGFGTDVGLGTCLPGPGFLLARGDCDDGDAATSPLGQETCAVGDEDCDGLRDSEDPSVEGLLFYPDLDGDETGAGAPIEACALPSGYAETDDDCDDTSAEVSPLLYERYGDDVDEDCDGEVDPPPPPPCVGVRIPGDYASITAYLSTTGGGPGATICLGAGTFSGASAGLTRDLVIQGAGRDQTRLEFGVIGGVQRNLTLRGVTFLNYLEVQEPGSLTVEDCRMTPSAGLAAVTVVAGGAVTLRRTEVDLSRNGLGDGIGGWCGNDRPVRVVLENVWFHDGVNAVRFNCGPPYIGTPANTIVVEGALFDRLRGNALYGFAVNGSYHIDVEDTIFRDVSAHAISGWSSTFVTVRDTVFDNTPLRYLNLGPTTEARVLAADARLDDRFAPPRPSGAPLEDAGGSGRSVDYWGEGMIGAPDIGPVER